MEDPAGFGDGVVVDFLLGFGWEVGGGGGEDVPVGGALGAGVDLVVVEAGAFPVLVKGEEELGDRLGFEPGDVGADLGGLAEEVVAVEVNALGVFAGVPLKSSGVEGGADEPVEAVVEEVFPEEGEEGLGAGGFIAVDAGGEVDGGFCGVAFGGGPDGVAVLIEEGFGVESPGGCGVLPVGEKAVPVHYLRSGRKGHAGVPLGSTVSVTFPNPKSAAVRLRSFQILAFSPFQNP